MRKAGKYTVRDTKSGEILIKAGTIEECSEVLGIKPSSFYTIARQPRTGISIEKAEGLTRKTRKSTQKNWITVDEGVPEDSDVVLVSVSGHYKNIEFVGAIMLATFDPEGGWILEEYPEWEDPFIECWGYIPKLPKEVQKYIKEKMGAE